MGTAQRILRVTRRGSYRVGSIGTLLLAMALLAACGRSSAAGTLSAAAHAATPNVAAANASVRIQSLAFSPATVTIDTGESVTWTNKEALTSHTVTNDAGDSAAFNQLLGPGDTFTFQFTQPGSYPYHCSIHPSMHGTVIVNAAATPTDSPTATATVSQTSGPTPTAVPTSPARPATPTPTSPPEGK